MNVKQKRILTVLLLAFSVLVVVLFFSTIPWAFVPGNGGGDVPPDPPPDPVVVIPSAPTLQQLLSPDDDGTISLIWSIISEADGYQVYMSMDGGSWNLIKVTGVFAYVHHGLTNGVYSFKVRAYNSAGCSYMSNVRSVTVSIAGEDDDDIVLDDDDIVPDAPNLRLMVNSPSIDGEIKLEWDSVSGATMYTIFRWKDGINPEILKQDFSENYYDDSVSSNGVYSYKVKAGNSEKEYSEYSNEVSITVQIPEVPDVPVMNELEYEIINYTVQVYIDWEVVDCDSYILYRSFDGEVYKPVEGGIYSATGYTEFLTEAGTYVYKVSAVNTHGESEMSNSVTIEITEDGGVALDYTMLYVLLVILGVLIVPIAIVLVKRKKR